MSEVRYLRQELLEAIARNTIKNYDPSLILGADARSIPIEDIIESLGLSLEYQYIRKNGRILGETIFDDDYIPLYNMEEKKYEALRESLLSAPKNGYDRICAGDLQAMEPYCREYMRFISDCKIEREAVEDHCRGGKARLQAAGAGYGAEAR